MSMKFAIKTHPRDQPYTKVYNGQQVHLVRWPEQLRQKPKVQLVLGRS